MRINWKKIGICANFLFRLMKASLLLLVPKSHERIGSTAWDYLPEVRAQWRRQFGRRKAYFQCSRLSPILASNNLDIDESGIR